MVERESRSSRCVRGDNTDDVVDLSFACGLENNVLVELAGVGDTLGNDVNRFLI